MEYIKNNGCDYIINKYRLQSEPFDKENEALTKQFDNINWIENSGISEEELRAEFDKIMQEDYSTSILKAKAFELILEKSRLAIDKDDIFQDKLYGGNLMVDRMWKLVGEVKNKYLQEETKEMWDFHECGAGRGDCDFGHTSPNSKLLLEIGFLGLLERILEYSKKDNLTDKQKEFYQSCEIVLKAMMTFSKRMSEAVKPYDEECSKALESIAYGKPQNIYEAMQLIIIYFFLHEYIAGTRVRTLGRVDVMLYPFYVNDIKNGTFAKEEIKEMLKYFLNKFWAAKVPFDLPFALAGMDENGDDVTNEISYLVVEVYNELNIHSPKIHIRVSDKTPQDFVKLVLNCIRGGNSSFVFVNDNVCIKSLMSVGITEKEARNYVPIGCYEPAVWGVEIGCTGGAGINLAKAVEFAITNGKDFESGKQISIETGEIKTYDDFTCAVKKHIAYMLDKVTDYVTKIEKYYMEISPDPILSAMYDECVKRGVDAYDGGAKYNNSSVNITGIASLVDITAAVKKLVFDDKKVTFDEMCNILKNNWADNEQLRMTAKNLDEKYGNGNPLADSLTKEYSDFVAECVNNKPNGRGGVFKAGLFSIDRCFYYGTKTMATPDGRFAGEPLSKNLCAVTAMDKKGITALINSVTQIDHSKFPNGSVLDIVLHPSAVTGDDGLTAMYGILKTYMNKGGFAMHGNVFNPEDLKEAQKNPEKYANLQVRVCGWNVFFVNLSKAEQDAFIKQAENNC